MIRVGVLRGGMSDEFDVSVKSGAAVLSHLPPGKYQGVDILITKDGTWHVGGIPKSPRELSLHIDVAWNALHGEYGEDGQVARMLEEHHIPYTGSEALPSALALNKPLAKEALRRSGIKTPAGITVEDYRDSTLVGRIPEKIHELALKIFKGIPAPWVLKPARGGSSINTFVAKNWNELVDALSHLFKYGGDIVVEQYLSGKEVSSGVIEDFRHERYYPLMPVEVPRHHRHFFDYASKQSPDFICPSTLNPVQKAEVAELAKKAHQTLGLRDYSISDFIVTPRGIYLLEVNNNPKCGSCSIMAKSLEAVGSHPRELIDHIISLAMARK